MIKITNLTKSFGNRNVLNNINLELPNKGLIVLFGDSGSGKTTLLNCIGGVTSNYSGSISINNVNISSLNDIKRREFRLNHIGYVFQNYRLINLSSVIDNIKIPLDAISQQDEKIKIRRVRDAMRLLGIEKLEKQQVNLLSGGEKQRVAIARAIINSPDVLLCDEPTGALDEKNSELIYQIIKTISFKKLVIVASHDKSISQYADLLFHIEDGQIVSSNVSNIISIPKSKTIFGENFKRKKSSLSTRFKDKFALSKLKAKKIRSVITYTILSLSLTGIGLSLLISFSVSGKINDAFASLTNGNQIVMSMKNSPANAFNGIYSAPESNVLELYEKYNYYLDGYGVTYLVNFEDFFKDRNDFYFPIRGQKISIASLSTRSINDFRFANSSQEDMTYPYIPESLSDDQVILGLSYVDMVNLCFSLQIQRNYSSLGTYLRENQLFLTLEVENSSWAYDDEQIFEVMAVRETNKSCFYHYNNLWNQAVFEKMMLLPSDDDQDKYYPWEMYKIYFFKTIEDPSVFINATLNDSEAYDYVFERTSYSYHPLLCKIGEVCQEKRVIIYYVDKNGIDTSLVKKMSSINGLDKYYYVNDYGYASYASNMLSGFAKNTFVSLSKDKLDEAIDADTSLQDNSNAKAPIPDGVISGNYLTGISGGLRFSTRMDKLILGRLPKSINEIAISTGLSNKFKIDSPGKELYISSIINEYLIDENKTYKEYQTTKVVIVGFIEEENDYLYNDGNWTISFFRDLLGVSMFNLIPKSVVFEVSNDIDVSKLCLSLRNNFRNMTFTSPKEELSSSVDSTFKYANAILIAFSIIAILISVILLGTVVTLNIMESKDDISLLSYIGISKKDIESLFVHQSLFCGLVAFVLSSIEIVAVDIALSYSLSDMFSANFSYSFNPIPLAVIFLCSIFVSIFVSLILSKLMLKNMDNYG